MRVIIIGSTTIPAAQAKQIVDQVHPAFIGEAAGDTRIGTFLRGGIHEYVASFAELNDYRLIKFHSAQAMCRWKPDRALIVWDGSSRGCMKVNETFARAKIETWILLVQSNGKVHALGSHNRHAAIAPAPGQYDLAGDYCDGT